MSKSTPAIARVHYVEPVDGTARTFTGAVAADQQDGTIALVANEAAWADPHVCCWRIALEHVTRVEVLRPAHEPSIMEQLLDAIALTPREQVVYDALAHVGGPVQYRDVADIVRYDHGWDSLEPHQILAALQALKEKGRVTLEHSTGMDSGIVTITGRYRDSHADEIADAAAGHP